MHKEPDDPQWLLDFDRALARTSDPDTSHEAAEKINVTKRQKEVLRTLSGKRLTASEIADLMRLNRDSVSPRMKPLERWRLVEVDGDKVVINPNRKPGRMKAYIITAAGINYLASEGDDDAITEQGTS